VALIPVCFLGALGFASLTNIVYLAVFIATMAMKVSGKDIYSINNM